MSASETLRDIRTLTSMQLKDKAEKLFKNSKKRFLYKTVLSIVGFAAITALLYLVFFFTVAFKVLTLGSEIPVSALVFLFTVLQVISIFSTTARLTQSLYFAHDNKLLLTLPVNTTYVFLSKLIVYYVSDLKRNYTYVVPLFLAFGLVNGYSPVFIPLMLVAPLFYSLIFVVASAVLSLPALWIMLFVRKYQFLQIGLFGIILAVFTAAVFWVVSKIPPDINIIKNFGAYYWQLQSFLTSFAEKPYVFIRLTELVTGVARFGAARNFFPIQNLYTLLGILAFSVSGIAVILLAIKPLFFKMASKPFEFRKRQNTDRRNKARTPFLSALKKETLLNLRTPSVFFSDFAFIFGMPLALYLLNKIFANMDTRYVGDAIAVAINYLIILLILLSNNVKAASILSSEGDTIYHMKVNPSSFRAALLAKLTISYVLSLISTVMTCAIVGSISKMGFLPSFLMCLSIILVNTAHVLWSIDMDIMNPQYKRYHGGVHEKINPNEMKSAAAAFILSFLFFGIFLYLIMENAQTVFLKVTLIGAAVLALRVWLNGMRLRVMLKDM